MLIAQGACSSARAAGELGPNRWGLPGLGSTVLAPEGLGAPLRLGLFYEGGRLDPSHGIGVAGLGTEITSHSARLQVSVRASRLALLAVNLPWRSVRSSAGDDLSGPGDIELGTTASLYRHGRSTAGLWGGLRLPTGDDTKGLSTGQVEGELGLHLTTRFFSESLLPQMRWTINVGHRWNKNERDGYGLYTEGADPRQTGVFFPLYPSVERDENRGRNDELLLRTAVEFRRRWGHLFLEASLDWLQDHPRVSFRENASWITPGIYLGSDESFALKLAWSIGLFSDDPDTEYEPALPDWFVSVGVSYPLYLGGRDRDLDGIADKEDLCPTEPEDIDGTEDEDGCPDLDNDGDGVPDRVDLAPNLPEDIDGFEDADGRPDLDNDLDGIPDVQDACPLQPEDYDGFEDDDGCPDVFVDADGDGIEDAADACPAQPEDYDGFEDEDGCPELDNDLDGIPDAVDQCPDLREDYNGVDDDDGCPETS